MIQNPVSEQLPYPARIRLVAAAMEPSSVKRQDAIDRAIISIKREYPSYFRPEALVGLDTPTFFREH